MELLRDLWLTTPLTVPTASELSSLKMRFRDGGTRREESETHEKGGGRFMGALGVSASDVSREDFNKGRNRRGEKDAGKKEVPRILPSTWNAVKGEY